MRTKCNAETTEVGLIYKLDGYEYWKSFQELEGDEVETVEQPLQEPLFTCNRIVPKKFKNRGRSRFYGVSFTIRPTKKVRFSLNS